MEQAVQHNATPIGASTKVKYTLSYFGKSQDAVLSTYLKNITLTSKDGVVIFNEPLASLTELRRSEFILQFKVNAQKYFVQFGKYLGHEGYATADAISMTPGQKSIAQSNLLTEAGQDYWLGLISKHTPLLSDRSPQSRIGWTNKLDTVLLIVVGAMFVLAMFGLLINYLISKIN